MLFLLLQYVIAGLAVSDCRSMSAVPMEQTAVLYLGSMSCPLLLVELDVFLRAGDRIQKKEHKKSCNS